MNSDDHNAPHTVGQQPDALQYILDNNRFEHVQLGPQALARLTAQVEQQYQARHLKLTLRTRKYNSSIVTHHLCGDHRECLTLGRVDINCQATRLHSLAD